MISQHNIFIYRPGHLNGVAIWADFSLLDGNTVTTGLLSETKQSETLKWDMYTRQGVHLFRYPTYISPKSHQLEWKANFNPTEGNFKFDFNILAL